jgi:hypothetical protein
MGPRKKNKADIPTIACGIKKRRRKDIGVKIEWKKCHDILLSDISFGALIIIIIIIIVLEGTSSSSSTLNMETAGLPETLELENTRLYGATYHITTLLIYLIRM